MAATAATSSALGRVASSEKPHAHAAMRSMAEELCSRLDTAGVAGIDLDPRDSWSRSRNGPASSLPAPRDHVGLVVEPQRAVLAQHVARGLEIAAIRDHL